VSRLNEFFPAFTNAEVTDPGERARRLQESVRRHLPSVFVEDAQRMRDDRAAFQIAIRRYDEQRASAIVQTIKVVA
jgi:hypothetical protein